MMRNCDNADLPVGWVVTGIAGFLLLVFYLCMATSALAADDMVRLVPPAHCGGWKIIGMVEAYDREMLSKQDKSELESFVLYGFDRMVSAHYTAPAASSITVMNLEIYRMGSALDAFGIFAAKSSNEGKSISVGIESSFSGSLLYFYHGRSFVKIYVTGGTRPFDDAIAACAKEVVARLPATNGRPAELKSFAIPEVVAGSVRYFPQKMLRTDVFKRGIMADAVINGSSVRIFKLLDTGMDSAAKVFEGYYTQLDGPKAASVESGGINLLQALDPFYGKIMLLQRGTCLSGAFKFSSSENTIKLLRKVCN
jgi:hypothetical protein